MLIWANVNSNIPAIPTAPFRVQPLTTPKNGHKGCLFLGEGARKPETLEGKGLQSCMSEALHPSTSIFHYIVPSIRVCMAWQRLRTWPAGHLEQAAEPQGPG